MLILALCAGCGTPEWLERGSGVERRTGGAVIQGVGQAKPDKDAAAQEAAARLSAENAVKGALAQYLQEELVYFWRQQGSNPYAGRNGLKRDDPGNAERVAALQGRIAAAIRENSKQTDKWKDPRTDDLYVLVEAPLTATLEGVAAGLRQDAAQRKDPKPGSLDEFLRDMEQAVEQALSRERKKGS